ncbi:hypothetical protein BJ138DRAFT_1175876 [Hygrophoropsis aurantiaca]|uniref:Uncharacterized protein n=1 Tax=Hygrophoropsis aurantiaca TaxID=72124 RepID=A0ACB8ASP0_9AGAM|nr:hypothetical protein BJ138DRAFT_1175876 [Hygrophoropsis aurantiaca]
MFPFNISLDKSKFSLDASGIAGAFGGDEAISAMATVHLFKGRRWWGWYNSPGSYIVGKRFGQLANSRFWDGLFPGPNVDPAVMFELDGKVGPKFVGAHSGTVIKRTTQLAYLLSERCKDLPVEKLKGRVTRPQRVTIVELEDIAHDKPLPTMSVNATLLACIPTLVSAVTCIACAFTRDWYSFSMILLGIVSSGIAYLVLGSGVLRVDPVKEHAPGVPPGDGILLGEEIVILKGKEGSVSFVTKGKFVLDMAGRHAKTGPKRIEDRYIPETRQDKVAGRTDHVGIRVVEQEIQEDTHSEYRSIGLCSLLLVMQFISQLLLVPQGTLFGQIMFLLSLAVSWAYNSFLSSLEKNKIQADILHEFLNKPSMKRYELKSRTATAVFVVLVLQPANPMKILNQFLPNDTAVWNRWKELVVHKILQHEKLRFDETEWPQNAIELSEGEQRLLRTLLRDANAAWEGYISYRPGKFADDLLVKNIISSDNEYDLE